MNWVLNIFRRNKLYNDLSEEMQLHIEERVEQLKGEGLSTKEAERQARVAFGNQALLEERSREVWLWSTIESFWADVKFACRQLAKSPTFTAASILILALGIGATTAIFSAMKAVLLAPLPYQDINRIVAVWTATPGGDGRPGANSAGDFDAWKRSGVFASLAPSHDDDRTLTGQGAPQFLIGYSVSATYLRILGVQPEVGRLFADSEDNPGAPKVVLLSDHLWRTTFHADPNIVGKSIVLDGATYSVVGVMPREFDYPASVQVWTPTAMSPAAFDDFKDTDVRILGRLKPGMTVVQAREAINQVESAVASSHPDTDAGNRVVLVPLRQQLTGDIRAPLLILMEAVGLVLLIACANVAGLAVARDAKRQREIAIRIALGATRLRLLRQFMTESLVLALVGGSLGILLAVVGKHFLLPLFPTDVANLNIPRITTIPMDRGVFLFAVGITLLSAFLSGIIPVLKALRTEPNTAIKDAARGTTRRSNRTQSGIAIGEVALALILLTGAGLVATSLYNVTRTGFGFEPDHLLSLQVFLPADRYPSGSDARRVFVQQVVTRLSELPGVNSAAATNFLPLSGFWGTTNFLLREQIPAKGSQGPEADNLIITPDYLHTMKIPLERGRSFSDADRAGGFQVAMINKTLASEHFGNANPVGQSLNLGTLGKPDWWQIVGVVADVKSFGQDQPTHAEIYRPFDQIPFPLVAFTIRTKTDPARMSESVKHALWSVDPNLPVLKETPMDVLADQSIAVRRSSTILIASFALLALVLSSIGIYGVMAYMVAQRTQEVGIRMALGANRLDVLRLMLTYGTRITAVGVAIGLLGAFATSRLLASLLYGTKPSDPLTILSVTSLLCGVTTLSCIIPARRAANIDPITALRYD